jgi:competence protein ComEA
VNRYRGLALGVSALVLGTVIGLVLLGVRDSWRAPQIVISDPLPGSVIGASVSGAVATPGVYLLPADSRITHLLDAAGGATEDADLAYLNLAARLRDEQQIVVPTLAPAVASGGEREAEGTAGPAFGIAGSVDIRLNINTASEDELDGLPGIGPVLARLIVEERERAGQYGSVDELVRIPGISQKMVDEFRDQVTT